MFLLALLLGCPRPVDCTTEARASVNLTVVSADDAVPLPLSEVEATWEQAGGERAPCDALGDGRYACGWEVSGHIDIHVEAPGFAPYDQTVEVGEDEDGCHVAAVSLSAALVPEVTACDDPAPPAVHAIVLGAGGEDLTGVSVRWSDPVTDGIPRDCVQDPVEPETWWCEGYVGEVAVWAAADGHEEQVEIATVAGNACGPITEEIVFELGWLPD